MSETSQFPAPDNALRDGPSRRAMLRGSVFLGAATAAGMWPALLPPAAHASLRGVLPDATAYALARRDGGLYLLVGSPAGPSVLALSAGSDTWSPVATNRGFSRGVLLRDMVGCGPRLLAGGHRRRRRHLGEVRTEAGEQVAMTVDLIEPVLYGAIDDAWEEIPIPVPLGSVAAVASDGKRAVLGVVDVYDEPGVMERSGVAVIRSRDGGVSWQREDMVAPVALSEGFVGGASWHEGRFLVGGATHRSSYLLAEDGPSWTAVDQPPGETGLLLGLASHDGELVLAYSDEEETRLWSRAERRWSRLALPARFRRPARPVRPVATGTGVALVGRSGDAPAVAAVGGV